MALATAVEAPVARSARGVRRFLRPQRVLPPRLYAVTPSLRPIYSPFGRRRLRGPMAVVDRRRLDADAATREATDAVSAGVRVLATRRSAARRPAADREPPS